MVSVSYSAARLTEPLAKGLPKEGSVEGGALGLKIEGLVKGTTGGEGWKSELPRQAGEREAADWVQGCDEVQPPPTADPCFLACE